MAARLTEEGRWWPSSAPAVDDGCAENAVDFAVKRFGRVDLSTARVSDW